MGEAGRPPGRHLHALSCKPADDTDLGCNKRLQRAGLHRRQRLHSPYCMFAGENYPEAEWASVESGFNTTVAYVHAPRAVDHGVT